MRNIKLFLQFDGAAFHGFQQQPNGDTVEAQLKKALSRLLGEACTVYGCSRTDAGVHATESDRDCDKLLQGLNAVLPPQISVLSCAQAPESFHARYDCRAKEYAYCIWNGRTRNPFLLQRALFYPFPLDVAFLNVQAQDFVGTHDVSAFCASGASTKTSVCTIERCSVVRTGELVTFTVCGNGFLYPHHGRHAARPAARKAAARFDPVDPAFRGPHPRRRHGTRGGPVSEPCIL